MSYIKKKRPFVKTEIINGKRKTVYHRRYQIPGSLAMKTEWLHDAKRRLKPNVTPRAFYQLGGDRFGLYCINQTFRNDN